MSFFPFCRFGTLSAFHVSCICVCQPFLVFMFSVLIYLFSLHCPSPSLALFVTSSSIFRPLLAATMLPYFHRPTLFPAHFPFRLNAVANDSSYRSRCRPFPIMYPSTRPVYPKFEAAFLQLRSDGAYREAGEYFLSCRLFAVVSFSHTSHSISISIRSYYFLPPAFPSILFPLLAYLSIFYSMGFSLFLVSHI